jgi:hypothetical protein
MTIKGNIIRLSLLILTIVLAVSISKAQEQVATVVSSSASKASTNAPVYSDYRGVSIGMTADEVRAKLNGIKKG